MPDTQTQSPTRTLPVSGWMITLIVVMGSLVLWLLFGRFLQPTIDGLVTPTFWLFVGAGFLAQTVDGALGMAYGISSTSLLLSLGVNPAAASASVHIAEVFTTGASGLSHYKLGNVNKKLFKLLVIPGVIGAVTGA